MNKKIKYNWILSYNLLHGNVISSLNEFNMLLNKETKPNPFALIHILGKGTNPPYPRALY